MGPTTSLISCSSSMAADCRRKKKQAEMKNWRIENSGPMMNWGRIAFPRGFIMILFGWFLQEYYQEKDLE